MGPSHLVRGVVDEGSAPLALVGRVGLAGCLPLTAARGVLAQRVGNAWWLPLAILLLVPVHRLLRLCGVVSMAQNRRVPEKD